MRSLLFVALLLLPAGCAPGLIYRHTFEPLMTDFRETPIGERTAAGDIKDFDYYIEVQWESNAIGELAAEHGFEEVYYADIETLSILGIWTQIYVHIYGR